MELNLQKYEQFQNQVQAFISTYWKLYRRYSRLNMGLIVLGLLIGAGVTITGFMKLDIWPGILGAPITLLLGLQNAFDFSGKAAFFHVVHDEAKVLRDRLRYKVKTQEDFEEIVDAFSVLRVHAVKKLPLGSGMEATKNDQ